MQNGQPYFCGPNLIGSTRSCEVEELKNEIRLGNIGHWTIS